MSNWSNYLESKSNITFSKLAHRNEFLIIKHANGQSFSVGSIYLESVCDLVIDLLQKHYDAELNQTQGETNERK